MERKKVRERKRERISDGERGEKERGREREKKEEKGDREAERNKLY